MTPNAAVPSPCVDICQMDVASGRCTGCLRTLDEITAWPRLDDAGKRALWQQLAERRAQRDLALGAPAATAEPGALR